MNPPIDRSDSALRAWLEQGPDHGRPEAIERALAATRRVPQRPGWTYPERWLPVNRALIAAAATVIVVVGAAAFFLRPVANVGPPGSPTPIPTSLPSATPGPLPPELLKSWVGVPHDFPTRSNVQSLTLGYEFGQLSVNANFVYGQSSFTSQASVVGANTLELKAVSNGCGVGLMGHYTWSLSPGGTLLHLALVDDACAERPAAFVGDWHAANCKDTTDMCWGDLEAGTYPTLFYAPRLDPAATPGPLYGGITFTVPDGWAVAGDHTSDVRLLRTSDYAKEGPSGPVGQSTGIEGWIRPAAVMETPMCADAADSKVERTASGLATSLSKRSALAASAVHDITIDGHAGKWVDVHLATDWTSTCGGSEPAVVLIKEAVGGAGSVGDDPYVVGISGQSRFRVVFVDIGKSDLGTSMTAMILVTAPDQTTFDSFVNEAMPIVQSFHFK